MASTQQHSAFGIGFIACVVAVGVSIGFYQLVYIPEISAKPQIPKEVLNPLTTTEIKIISGSSDPQQQDNFTPKRVEVELAANNKVVWTNEDSIGHTVTSDNDAIDRYTGPFDSLKTIGLVQPGKSYEFLFTQEGEFPYHCEPHPWMTGLVKVVKQKF